MATPKCNRFDCPREARMAIRTARSGDKLTSTVYYDNRDAPKNAVNYCKTHGVPVIAELAGVLVDGDDDPKEISPEPLTA